MKWHRIAGTLDEIILNSNNIVEITAGGKTFCIGKGNQGWYAFAQKCPHAGGFMSEGYIDSSDFVVCPVHRYKFNLQNGRNQDEGYYLKIFQIEERAEGVFVGFP